MGTHIGRPPVSELHQRVRKIGGDLAEQLRQLRVVARELRLDEAEVERVRVLADSEKSLLTDS